MVCVNRRPRPPVALLHQSSCVMCWTMIKTLYVYCSSDMGQLFVNEELIKVLVDLFEIYFFQTSHNENYYILLGKICYRTLLFCVVCPITLLNCVFARTHGIVKKEKFYIFSLKPVISNKSVKLSIFGTAVCSSKYVIKL
jgi:hypothetical protein